MAITISELIYFLKTAELQNVTKAAQELHIMQPSLSRSISALEDDLGVQLFDRTGRNVVLNRYGEIVQSYASRIINLLNTMQNELNNEKGIGDKTITVSFSSASTHLAVLISDFNKTFPDIHFDILQHSPRELNNYAKQSDLTIFSSSVPISNDHTVILLEENLLLAVPENDPAAGLTDVRLSDFADHGFIAMQKWNDLRTITDYYCKMADFVPQILLESDSPHTVREFIKAGIGVAFVPEITWSEVSGENISLKRIQSPSCVRYICLSWNPTGYLSAHAARFRDFLINHFEEYARRGKPNSR
ncbi:MAG: LysR family transcriptional regulator [Solobacterium sp.]|nr:LysR family transcriptional regulator [Solobacterium sp.]